MHLIMAIWMQLVEHVDDTVTGNNALSVDSMDAESVSVSGSSETVQNEVEIISNLHILL